MNIMIKKGAILALVFVVLLTIVGCNTTTYNEVHTSLKQAS